MNDEKKASVDRESPKRLTKLSVQVLSVAFAAWLLTNVDQSLFGYVVPEVMETFDIGLSTVSYIISLSFIAGMIIPVGIGVLAGKVGTRWALGLALGISALLVGAQGLVPSLSAFAIFRIISFGLSASLSPLTNTLVAYVSPEKWRPIMIALLQCAYPLGWLLSSIIVAPLIEILNWRYLFFFGFLVVPIAWLLGALLPKDSVLKAEAARLGGSTQQPSKSPIKELFSKHYRKRSILVGLAFFLNSGAVAATAFYFPAFLQEVRGYDASAAAIIVGAGYGISVIGYLGSALVSAFLLSRRNTIIIWNWVAAALFVCMIWVPTSFSQDLAIFMVLGIFFYGTSAILITFLLELYPDELKVIAASVCGTACVSGSMAVFPVIVAGLVPVMGWQMAFTVIVFPALILSGATMIFLKSNIKPQIANADYVSE